MWFRPLSLFKKSYGLTFATVLLTVTSLQQLTSKLRLICCKSQRVGNPLKILEQKMFFLDWTRLRCPYLMSLPKVQVHNHKKLPLPFLIYLLHFSLPWKRNWYGRYCSCWRIHFEMPIWTRAMHKVYRKTRNSKWNKPAKMRLLIPNFWNRYNF